MNIEKRLARFALLLIVLALIWLGGVGWAEQNMGEAEATFCLFSPFIIFGTVVIICLTNIAFFRKG